MFHEMVGKHESSVKIMLIGLISISCIVKYSCTIYAAVNNVW